MDKPREQQPRALLRPSVFASLALCLAFALAWSLFGGGLGVPQVDADGVRLGTVERRDLVVEVNASGALRPSELEWVSARSEGRVTALHKRAGETVVAGDILLQLVNPDLVNAAEEARAALAGARAAMKSYEVDLDNEVLNQKARALQARFAYESALLKLQAETRLRESSDIIPDIDYKRTQLPVEPLRATFEIEKERSAKSQANIAAQLAARQAQVDQLQRAHERAVGRVDALIVRAGMDGVVQQMDVEVGQRLAQGVPVAKVARQDRLYAELRVLARQAGEVLVGQSAVVDTRSGKINGRISRVDPAVKDGVVVVDVELLEALPAGARPELAVEGIITVSHRPDTLVVGIPSDGRGQSRFSVFRLGTADLAERVSVQAGRASLHHIEILEGLNAGDRIVLSDTRQWRDWDQVRIN